MLYKLFACKMHLIDFEKPGFETCTNKLIGTKYLTDTWNYLQSYSKDKTKKKGGDAEFREGYC